MNAVGSSPRIGISVRGLSKNFGGLKALDQIDIDVRDGEFLCIVGPSGCGKTTLLRILADLEAPTRGEIRFDVDQGARPLQSMVFQEQGVFPWLTVIENAAFGLTVRGVPKAERLKIAEKFLDNIGLSAFASAYPHQLSGGMKQRVNITRDSSTIRPYC